MAIKTYVLLESMDAGAPIYLQTPEGRSQIKKIPRHRPYLQVTLQDKEGKSRTLRYKSQCDTVWQDEQIKLGIDANAKFTQIERDVTYFKYGILTTDKINLQTFLENHPEFEGFKGSCDEVKKPCYKLLDKVAESKIKNEDSKKRIRAAYKIIGLDLEQATEMLIRINGSWFETPKDIAECQNLLTDFLDSTDEKGIEEILKEELNIDEQTAVLIGKLINADLLKFDVSEGTVSKKIKDQSWLSIREMSKEYSVEQRKKLFSDFLNTEDGKLIKSDLEKDLSDFEKAKKKSVSGKTEKDKSDDSKKDLVT